MITIFKNDFCSAIYNPTTKTVQTEYVGLVKVEAIKNLLRKVIEFSNKEEITHMVANLSKMEGTFTGALEFFETEFYPTMIKNGLKSYAQAVSNDIFTKFSSSQLSKNVANVVEWKAFPNLEEAEAWTKTKQEAISQ